ncbi:MAG TPA: PilZ domain-containing protein [Bryobacteraceae bacterium]|nr:PilZ domain-containing protein [Bryobacteraceae bacterium]
MSLPQSDPKQAGAVTEKGAGKRLHARNAVQRQVRLCWRGSEGDRILQARAIDISSFGMLVEAEKAIPPGTLVSVQTNATMIGKACVRHCTPKGAKYRIGLLMPDRMVREL